MVERRQHCGPDLGRLARTPVQDLHPERGKGTTRAAAPRVPRRRVSAFGKRVQQVAPDYFAPTRAFRTNQPALDLFPTTLWAQITGRRLRRAAARHPLRGPPPR